MFVNDKCLSINVANSFTQWFCSFCASICSTQRQKRQHTNTGGNLLNPLIAQHRYLLWSLYFIYSLHSRSVKVIIILWNDGIISKVCTHVIWSINTCPLCECFIRSWCDVVCNLLLSPGFVCAMSVSWVRASQSRMISWYKL